MKMKCSHRFRSATLCTGLLLFSLSTRAENPASPLPFWALRVHLLSNDERVELRRLSVSGREEFFICKAPCGAELQVGSQDQFVLNGPGVVSSAPFQLPSNHGDITLRVTASDNGPRVIGGVLIVGGGATLSIAGLTWLVESAFGNVFCDQDSQCISGNNTRRNTTLAITAGGLAVSVLGLVLLLTSRPTRFAVEQ
jgi:hypothetical protein